MRKIDKKKNELKDEIAKAIGIYCTTDMSNVLLYTGTPKELGWQ